MKKRYIFILIICLILTGCGSKKTNITKPSELTNIKNEMLKKINNYTYTISYDTKVDNKDTTLKAECKVDLSSKIEYCYINYLYYDIEEYIDYNTRLAVYRNIHPNVNETKWVHTNKYYNNKPNAWFNLVDVLKDYTKEEKEDGTYYTTVMKDAMDIAKLLQEVKSDIDPWDLEEGIENVPITVIVDKDGFIKKFDTSFAKGEKVEVIFKDINNTPKQEMISNY